MNPCVVERKAERAFAQFLRDPDPDVVGLAPGFDRRILLGWNGKIAAIHSHIAMEPGKQLRVAQAVAPLVLQAFKKNFLRVVMLGKGAGCTGNPHGFRVLN